MQIKVLLKKSWSLKLTRSLQNQSIAGTTIMCCVCAHMCMCVCVCAYKSKHRWHNNHVLCVCICACVCVCVHMSSNGGEFTVNLWVQGKRKTICWLPKTSVIVPAAHKPTILCNFLRGCMLFSFLPTISAESAAMYCCLGGVVDALA